MRAHGQVRPVLLGEKTVPYACRHRVSPFGATVWAWKSGSRYGPISGFGRPSPSPPDTKRPSFRGGVGPPTPRCWCSLWRQVVTKRGESSTTHNLLSMAISRHPPGCSGHSSPTLLVSALDPSCRSALSIEGLTSSRALPRRSASAGRSAPGRRRGWLVMEGPMDSRQQLWHWWQLALALVVSLGVLASRGHTQARLAEQAPAGGPAPLTSVGEHPPAPDFTLTTLSGTSLSLADLRGKVVLLNFWATWCVPCRKEMPAIEALYQRYKDQGLEVLAISLDKLSTAVVEAFVKEMGVTYRVALDPTWATARTYAVRAVPATFLIDRAGNVVLRELGERDWMEEAKQRAVEGLLQASGADTRQ